MSCIDGKGPRSFCGKEDCAYHFEKSFASFQGSITIQKKKI
jgi:hypothetical protein